MNTELLMKFIMVIQIKGGVDEHCSTGYNKYNVEISKGMNRI